MLTRQNKNLWQIILRSIFLLVAVGLSIFIVTFVCLIIPKAEAESNIIPFHASVLVIKKPVIDIGLPVRLKIPSINVDATIDYVSLDSSGAMAIKQSLTEVAWYELGARPGEDGSAVIAGHYGRIGNQGSVFNNLNKLIKGDEVLVTDIKGVSITFVVRESLKFDPNADASTVFKSGDGKAHLNLITCDGVWMNSENTYSDRLVVFTDKKI